jgi:hypothetical protein
MMGAQCVRRRLGNRRGGSSECAPPYKPSRWPRGQNRSTLQAVRRALVVNPSRKRSTSTSKGTRHANREPPEGPRGWSGSGACPGSGFVSYGPTVSASLGVSADAGARHGHANGEPTEGTRSCPGSA